MTDYEENESGEETIYDEEGREGLVEDGGISPEEAGFMKGYEDADEEPDEIDADDSDDE